jgi:hypothetical protein
VISSSKIAAASLESTSIHPVLNGAIARASTAAVATAAAATAATTTIAVAANGKPPIQAPKTKAATLWTSGRSLVGPKRWNIYIYTALSRYLNTKKHVYC